MNNNLIVRRLFQLGALFLIGDVLHAAFLGEGSLTRRLDELRLGEHQGVDVGISGADQHAGYRGKKGRALREGQLVCAGLGQRRGCIWARRFVAKGAEVREV